MVETKISTSIWCFLLFGFFFGCNDGRFEEDLAALKASNEVQKAAHLEHNATMLVSQIADTMIQVADGEIKKLSNEAIKERFQKYFKTVKYRRWDDMQEPVVELAKSGELASVTVHKIIETKPINAHDSLYEETIFAWAAIYRKINGQWKITTIVSTQKAHD